MEAYLNRDIIVLFFCISGIAVWLLLILGFLIALISHRRRLKEENDMIYQNELESLRKAKNKPKASDPDNLMQEIGKDSTITSWDLNDIDRSFESHMNF